MRHLHVLKSWHLTKTLKRLREGPGHVCVCECVCGGGAASFHGPQAPCPVPLNRRCRGLEARVPGPGFSEGTGELWLVAGGQGQSLALPSSSDGL